MPEKNIAGVVGIFAGPDDLMGAILELRDRNLGRLEAYTPYPVHGLPEALRLKRSTLGVMVFVAGFLGAVLALLFQWWTSAVDYPVRIGGKPFFSWQAFVPIMFEMLVLFGAFTAGLGMLLLLNRLPWFGDPILSSRAIARSTKDRFALAVLASGEELDVETASDALRALGGEEIEILYHREPSSFGKSPLPFKELLGIVIACMVAGTVFYHGIKWYPELPPMNRMTTQQKVVPYQGSDFFADGIGMRHPPEGSVRRGGSLLPVGEAERAEEVLFNPLPRTDSVFRQGRDGYRNFCQVCHDPLGQGRTSLSESYNAKPANLHGKTIRDYPDGRIFHVISSGRNTMPGYSGSITTEDRWAIVHYVRALQRALDARTEDLP